jgi:hypothetical protein
MGGRRASPVVGSAPTRACHVAGVCGRSPPRRSCRAAQSCAAHVARAPPISLEVSAGASAHGNCRGLRRRGNHPRLHAAGGPCAGFGIGRRGSGLFFRRALGPQHVAIPASVAALLSRQGVSGGPWHRPHALAALDSTIWVFWIPAVFFAALAWLNCSCIARWESTDESWEARSGSAKRALRDQRPKPPATFHASVLLACGGLFSAAVVASAHLRPAALLAAGATSALLLALLDRTHARMTPLALRAAADLVLLTPLALLSFAWALK